MAVVETREQRDQRITTLAIYAVAMREDARPMTEEEIADALGVKPQWVQEEVDRILEKLRRRLGGASER